MKTKKTLSELLETIRPFRDTAIHIKETDLRAEYKVVKDNRSIGIKILSMFGGLMASIAFIGFLYVTGLFDSSIGMILIGCMLITAAVALTRMHVQLTLDTLNMALFILGFILLGGGLVDVAISTNLQTVILIIAGALSLSASRHYLVVFVSVLIIHGGILMLIISNNLEALVYLYLIFLALLMVVFYLKEAEIIVRWKALSRLYSPIRTALVFSFISTLLLLSMNGLFLFPKTYKWIPAAVFIVVIAYLSRLVLRLFPQKQQRHIPILLALVLFPTLFAPAISGALLVVLLAYLVNHRTGFVVGITAFCYFMIRFYYDLDYTLLMKSLLLMGSGLLFLIVYGFIFNRKSS